MYIERIFYNALKNRPKTKNQIKKVYQRLLSPVGYLRACSTTGLHIRENAFFGFHDKSPWSGDGKYLLAHGYSGTGNEPETATSPVSIGCYSGHNWNTWTTLATTRAWNWQQGAQLQWAGCKNYRIIFNDFIDGTCKAIELDLTSSIKNVLSYPVGAFNKKRRFYATFCFKTLGAFMPGYGYDFESAEADSNISKDKLIVQSLQNHTILEVEGVDLDPIYKEQTSNENCFISHAQFNHSGTQLAFFRRQYISNRRLKSALYILNIDAAHITRAPFYDMVSHYTWVNDSVILCFANDSGGDGFFYLDTSKNKIKSLRHILGERDGHPHSTPDGRLVAIDSYPGRDRVQNLLIFFPQEEKIQKMSSLYAPMHFWDTKRVDMHPRIKPDGRAICFETSVNGKRSMATLSLSS